MSTACHNHTSVEAAGHCTGCAEPFCGNCLLELEGSHYCGSCKVMALRGRTPMLESAMAPCEKAGEAMKMAVIGFFCFGFILGPLAIAKAIGARGEIRDNVMLTGWGKANAALVLGLVVTILGVINLMVRMSR
jgi:hypothetical protein